MNTQKQEPKKQEPAAAVGRSCYTCEYQHLKDGRYCCLRYPPLVGNIHPPAECSFGCGEWKQRGAPQYG